MKTIQIYENEYIELRRRVRELEDQRRERIATAALQATINNPYTPRHRWADAALEVADELIELLDAKPESEEE